MLRASRHVARALLLFALLVPFVAACGSSTLDKRDYQDKVTKVGDAAESQLHGVVDGNSPPTAEQMQRAGSVFQQAARDLGKLEPPTKVAKAHKQLVDGFQLLGDSFARYSDNLARANSDADRAQVFVDFAADTKVQRAFDDLTAAQAAFRTAGYSKILGPDDGGATARSGAAPVDPSGEPTTPTTSTPTTTTKTVTPPPAT